MYSTQRTVNASVAMGCYIRTSEFENFVLLSGYSIVTICINKQMQGLFVDVADGEMELNKLGIIVENEIILT